MNVTDLFNTKPEQEFKQGITEGQQWLAESTVNSPVSSAITRRILNQRTDLLKYGPVAVMAAIDDVADFVGDVEEIGSSDVSGWVAQVERMLKENPPEAFEVEEGAVLKQAKRKYNQAAKDANADQVGAGKKIDTMKNSLRQKDVNKSVAETRRMDSYEKDVHASQQGFDRPNDHRGLRQELAHERNNLQISINGRPWKVVPGRGYADSQEERNYLRSMQSWAEKKSASTGKKWTVSLTGAEVSESQKKSELDEVSTELLGRYKTAAAADAKKSDAAGNYKRGDKRFSGIVKATKKQFDNDLKKHGQYEVNEGDVVQFPKKHKSDLDSFDDCPKCGRDLMGGTYMGHRVKVCNPCKQVYLPPNTGIDQKGNKIDEYGDTAKGQKMLTKVHHRAADRVTSKQADKDPAYARKAQQTQDRAYDRLKDVAEGSLNEFAPDGFTGGDDGDEFSPEMAKMAQEDGFTKGASLADGATLERAMKIQHWDQHDGGMYKQYFAKGFKAGRMDKIKFNNKQYNLNLKLMKDGSIRHGEQGVAEDDAGDVEQRFAAKMEKEKQRLAKLKQTDPEAYKREIAKSKTSSKVPPVSTFEGVSEASLGTVLQWPEVVNKVNSAMKAMGWKGKRKDDNSYMFSTKGQLNDEFYMVIIENKGNNMFHYALGTVEEGNPYIGEQETLPMTAASVSELMDSIREGFGLNEDAKLNSTPSAVNEQSSTSSEEVESAITRRILTQNTDLLMKYGPQKVMQAIEEVAYGVGDLHEIGTSDISAWVNQVKQILGAQ